MQRIFTADLLSKQPPYNTRELGASCVYADASETSQRAPSSMHGADDSFQQGYNQAYYMENVLPTARGYSSIGFQQTVPALSTFVPEHVMECRGAAGELTYIAVQDSYVFEWFSSSGWEVYGMINANADFIPQTCVVRGKSYFYFGTFVLYEYDFALPGLVAVDVQGIDLGAILGITSGGSQLVMFSSDTVYYSAVLDASDFLPALSTGAGSTGILALKGTIVAALPLGQDFVVYTQYSAVHARYTGNLTFPFVFSEIAGSSGIVSRTHVAYNTNTGSHIVYTNAGIQEVTASGAAGVFPEIADGISKGLSSYVNNLTHQLEYEIINAINVRLGFVANRYLFISLGNDPEVQMYQRAIVYDTSLQRWGSLNVSHTCIFEWAGSAAAEGIETYQDLSNLYPTYQDTDGLLYRDLGNLAAKYSSLNKQRIAIMSHTGAVCLLALTENGQGFGDNVGTDASMPRIFIGRIKVVRNQGTVLQWLRINKLVTGTIVLHGHDYNGAAVKLINNLSVSPRSAGTYTGRINADSLSVEIQGAFVLSELVLSATTGGTHLQYAPPVKKLNRLLYSPLYSIEGAPATIQEMMTSWVKGQFDPIMYEDVTVPTPSFVFGELRGVLQYLDMPAEVGNYVVPSTVSFLSGTLQQVLVTHSQPHQSDDSVVSTVSYITGQLTVVLLPHDQLYQSGDAVTPVTPTFISGTLS